MEQTTFTKSRTALKGQWEKIDHIEENVYFCTHCNLAWLLSNDYTPIENQMNYCPRCGAKMEDAVNDGAETQKGVETDAE